MLASEFLKLDNELNELGVFDALIDRDSNFFINIIRLKQSSAPEFHDAYNRINSRFSEIATLLEASKQSNMDDKMFRAARKLFNFSEVNGINLGFSNSAHGSGFGDKLSCQVLKDAYEIIRAGSRQPEIFHLVSLFEEGIGPDRLSDMIATIIKPNIYGYTLRILQELGIGPETRNDLTFTKEGTVWNPYKNCPLLLLPSDILHKLPIARDWNEIDLVVEQNNAIRREINIEIGAMWEKWKSAEKKGYLKQHIFMEPESCARVIDAYKSTSVPLFDLSSDVEYFTEVLFGELKKHATFNSPLNKIDSFNGTLEIINIFKDWVENNRGWDVLQTSASTKREKAVQRCIHLSAKHYIEVNDLDISFEPDEGRGPLDLKLSRGNDKTIAEIKLSTNDGYLKGYNVQIEEYAKSENTQNRIYVFIDLGNPIRLKRITEAHQANKSKGILCPELIIIDAQEKESASKFVPDDYCRHDSV